MNIEIDEILRFVVILFFIHGFIVCQQLNKLLSNIQKKIPSILISNHKFYSRMAETEREGGRVKEREKEAVEK